MVQMNQSRLGFGLDWDQRADRLVFAQRRFSAQ
jgi:hypothetical protein